MPRYAILTHDHPTLHWDLLLEDGAVLRAWRLLAEPQPGVVIAAEAIADHRLMYLDYEGPVSGDRGHVVRWDRGEFAGTVTGDELSLQWTGARLNGDVTLRKVDGSRWQFALAESVSARTGP